MKKKMRPENKKIDAILRRVDRLPVLDPRTPDEIVGYDEDGLPQSETPKGAVDPTVPDQPAVKYPDFAARRK